MRLSFSDKSQRSLLALAPVFFILCVVAGLLVLFLAGRFAYASATKSLTVSVDAQARSQLPVVGLESLERLEKRLDPAARIKWETRARAVQSQTSQP